MGTDIHPYVQARQGDDWIYIGEGPTRTLSNGFKRAVLADRHYHLFSILAGVRNGFGFAGCPTASPVRPIAEPRGLPEPLGELPVDPDPENGSGYPYLGDHSFSWVTLEEVERFPWDEPRVLFGLIAERDYEAFIALGDRTKPPQGEVYGGISGPGVVELDEPKYLRLKEQRALPATIVDKYDRVRRPARRYVRVSWIETHAAICEDFFAIVIPWLREVARSNGLRGEDVRIVFGFDS